MTKVRIIPIHVEGRPAMTEAPKTPGERITEMTQLLTAAFSLSGQPLVVDRSQVRIIRAGDREDDE